MSGEEESLLNIKDIELPFYLRTVGSTSLFRLISGFSEQKDLHVFLSSLLNDFITVFFLKKKNSTKKITTVGPTF